jgi:hypothetical protein
MFLSSSTIAVPSQFLRATRWLPLSTSHTCGDDRPPNQIRGITGPLPPASLGHVACQLSRLLFLLQQQQQQGIAIAASPAMETLTYKTPSPVTAKRRLSGIPTSRRPERVFSEQLSSRTQREWPDLEEREQRSRRGSIAASGELLRNLKEETDSVDSSMGFRELERVCR